MDWYTLYLRHLCRPLAIPPKSPLTRHRPGREIQVANDEV